MPTENRLLAAFEAFPRDLRRKLEQHEDFEQAADIALSGRSRITPLDMAIMGMIVLRDWQKDDEVHKMLLDVFADEDDARMKELDQL